MGLDAAFIERCQARAKNKQQLSSDFHTWVEHIPIFNLFIKLRRQFTVGGMGGYYGIPISAKKDLFYMAQITLDDQLELLDDIQLIEDGALQELNKKDGK